MKNNENNVIENGENGEVTRVDSAKFAKALFALVLLGVICVSLVRTHLSSISPSPVKAISRTAVEKWLISVRSGNEKAALLLAASITPDDDPEMPRADYVKLMLLNGLGTLLLTSPFNHFDYIRWRNALFCTDLARDVVRRTSKISESQQGEIFDMIQKKLRIAPPSDKKTRSVFASYERMWSAGEVSASNWFRLYSEVVFQTGAEIMVVSLFDEKSTVVYAVCEIRGKDGSKSVADPLKGKFWKGVGVADLAADPSRLSGIWSDYEITALRRPAYRLATDPMDFKIFEQRLSGIASRFDFEGSFRFGADPESRVKLYSARFADKNDTALFSYWHFPFSSLKSQKAFPSDWLAPKRTLEEFWINKRRKKANR
ncbi:MAG: hypothetical protein KAG97_03310 [Victivallales bacterium]|nr:hypothetical protein [Victivallales bacterium]